MRWFDYRCWVKSGLLKLSLGWVIRRGPNQVLTCRTELVASSDGVCFPEGPPGPNRARPGRPGPPAQPGQGRIWPEMPKEVRFPKISEGKVGYGRGKKSFVLSVRSFRARRFDVLTVGQKVMAGFPLKWGLLGSRPARPRQGLTVWPSGQFRAVLGCFSGF